MKDFNKPIPKEKLDIIEKTRSNLFAWRGQFSPQLIEVILSEYCLDNSVILDPFVGSGTILLEAGRLEFETDGFEINPAAYILSKIYEFINSLSRKEAIGTIQELIDKKIFFEILDKDIRLHGSSGEIIKIRANLDREAQKIFDALIILLNIDRNEITNELIKLKFAVLASLIENLPYSRQKISVNLSDARSLPLKNNQVDFVVTSPPYINVFNYHQNYRKSAELLGWNLLKIARSEIGSNRANRGNRFYTVVQYCLDIAETLRELSRVTKDEARIVFVMGHQSNVLGVPFYNADIMEKIATKANLFHKILRQERSFKNRFGKLIREDLINFSKSNYEGYAQPDTIEKIAREVAFDILTSGLSWVSSENMKFLRDAINKISDIEKTPIFEIRDSIDRLYQSA